MSFKKPSYEKPIINMKKYKDFRVRISQVPPMDVAFQSMAMDEYELLVATIYRLNDLIEVTNNYTEKIDEVLEWLLNEGLELAVYLQLVTWKEDGTLGDLINEILFTSKLDKVTFEEFKVEYNEFVEATNGNINDLLEDMSDFKADINQDLSEFKDDVNQEIVEINNKKADLKFVKDYVDTRYIPNSTYYTTSYKNENNVDTTLYVVRIPYENDDGTINTPQLGFANGEWDSGYQSAIDFDMLTQSDTVVNAGFLTYEGIYSKYIKDYHIYSSKGAGAIRGDMPNLLSWDDDGILKVFTHHTDVTTLGVKNLFMANGKIIENNIYKESWWENAGLSPNINKEVHPRSVIAQLGNNDYVIVTCTGREPTYWVNVQQGIGMLKMSQFLIEEFGDETIKLAFNLDGGGSTQLIHKGREVMPLHDGYRTKRRSVGSFLYFIKGDKKPKNQEDNSINEIVNQIRIMSKEILDLKSIVKNFNAIDWTNGRADVDTYDLDEIKTTGMYYVNYNYSTFPSGSSPQNILFVFRTNVNRTIQVLLPVVHSSMSEQYIHIRTYYSDTKTWQPWFRFTGLKI